MLGNYIEKVRKESPLIHNITNYVTVNDVANVLLACGASPIMADSPHEVEEITAISKGLTINIGTLSQKTIPAMFLAGKKANQLGHKVVLDPVGAGASKFRRETAIHLTKEVHFDVIRGNFSEMKTLALGNGAAKGVDVSAVDVITEKTLQQTINFLKTFAKKLGCIVVATGAMDLVTDEQKCYVIRNGRSEMRRITGTGCQLSALITAFLAANPGKELEATVAAVCMMGIAGEIGWENMKPFEGNASYRDRIIDAICKMDKEGLEKRAKYEIR